MLPIKFRLKVLSKLAQSAGTTGTTGSTGTTGTGTSGTSTTPATITPTPPDPSPPASSLYPYLRVAFDAARVGIVNSLCKMLSSASNISTGGKYNLQALKNINFQFDPSSFYSPDQKNLIVFFQKVYKTLLNNGQAINTAFTAAQIQQIVSYLLQSPELSNLSQVNPSGQVGQAAPAGDFKDNIRNLIARLQPTVTTRRA